LTSRRYANTLTHANALTPDANRLTGTSFNMKNKPAPHDLGRRERQIMDVIYGLGKGSVREVRELLPNPPSYSATRTMLNLLEDKGLLRHRREGLKYIYMPTGSPQAAKQSAVKHLIKTFFRGSKVEAAAAILDSSSTKLSDNELECLQRLIDKARREGQ